MVKALFDTNILIDHLNAVPQARDELARYESRNISVVTWMEVLIGAPQELEAATRAFLAGFAVVPLDDAVAEHAVRIRRAHRIKLPDAIIWASAEAHSRLLVTRNTRDFGTDTPGVRIPYFL
jgi:predicted nucleic acid-binding protein